MLATEFLLNDTELPFPWYVVFTYFQPNYSDLHFVSYLFVCGCDNFFPTSVESMMITFKLKEKFINSFSFRQCLVQSHSNSSLWRKVTFWGVIKLLGGGGGFFPKWARNSSVCY